jgi:HSP20 family protein
MAETQNRQHPDSSKEGSRQNIQSSDVQEREGSRGLARYGEWMTSPFSFMRRFSEEMDRLFEDFGLGGNPLARSTGGQISSRQFGRGLWNPPVEVFTKDDRLVVRAELPGIDKKDVKVECTEDEITIQGEKRQEHKEEHEGHYHSERSYGRFFRRIPLPEGIKPEDAKAVFRDGILEITMKAPKQMKSREIQIGE